MTRITRRYFRIRRMYPGILPANAWLVACTA
jgi:hypothetical protein